MNIIFLNAAIVSIIYFIIKLLEIKLVDKEEINIKLVFRDTLIVFFSVIASYYLLEQIKPMIYGEHSISSNTNTHTQVFTDNPSF